MKFNKKIFIRRKLLIVFLIFILVVVSLFIFVAINTMVRYYSIPPITKIDKVIVEKTNIKPGLPKQLKIPSIDVAAVVDYVGLKSDGAMDIKQNPDVVGWYMLGPRPGDDGSAVIAGHYGWADGKGSVFNDIHTLSKGDEVLVIDNNNKTITFIVREIRKYDPEADATNIFKSSDGKSHLNLITCEGLWVNDKQSYSNRLVVFSDKK